MPPLWRYLFMFLACDVLPVTRQRFGITYACDLLGMIIIKQTLLIPFPTPVFYSTYGLLAGILACFHLLYAVSYDDEPKTKDFPGMTFWTNKPRAPKFLFVMEPAIATMAASGIFLSAQMFEWTYKPFYTVIAGWFDIHIPMSWLNPYVIFMQQSFDGLPMTLLFSVPFLMPVFILMNNITEYVAEKAQQGQGMPDRGQATLSFPDATS